MYQVKINKQTFKKSVYKNNSKTMMYKLCTSIINIYITGLETYP